MTSHLVRLALALSLVSQVALPAADKESPSLRFEQEIKAYEANDAKSPPPAGAVLFTGASGIRLWKTLDADFPDHKVLNRGFGGCQMADVVYYADRIVIPYKPRMIIVQAGGNDLNSGKTPKQVLADFEALVMKVRAALPDARIAYLSSSPSPARWSQAASQLEMNRMIKEHVAAGKNLDYIESYDSFLGADGKPREDMFVADRLHHNAEGYKIRTALVKPHLP